MQYAYIRGFLQPNFFIFLFGFVFSYLVFPRPYYRSNHEKSDHFTHVLWSLLPISLLYLIGSCLIYRLASSEHTGKHSFDHECLIRRDWDFRRLLVPPYSLE